jgi:hypothetical protein
MEIRSGVTERAFIEKTGCFIRMLLFIQNYPAKYKKILIRKKEIDLKGQETRKLVQKCLEKEKIIHSQAHHNTI